MLNQVILIGRLVKKPELRESENRKNYLKATLAVQSDFRKKMGNMKLIFWNLQHLEKLLKTQLSTVIKAVY